MFPLPRSHVSLPVWALPLLGSAWACGLVSYDGEPGGEPASADGGSGGGTADSAVDGDRIEEGMAASGGAAPLPPGVPSAGSGGTSDQACPGFGPESFACPEACEALQEATCKTPTGYDVLAIEACTSAIRITWSTPTFRKACSYRDGELVGASATRNGDVPCGDVTTDEVTWGEQPTSCRVYSHMQCDDEMPAGEGGAPPTPQPQCYDPSTDTCQDC